MEHGGGGAVDKRFPAGPIKVRQLIEDAVNETPESSAVLIADTEAPTGVLIDLMDQVRLGGIAEISVSASRRSASAKAILRRSSAVVAWSIRA